MTICPTRVTFYFALTVFTLGMFSIYVHEGLKDIEEETFKGVVLDVNKDRIIFEDGTVMFAGRISKFDWKVGEEYNITIITNDFGIKRILDIKEI